MKRQRKTGDDGPKAKNVNFSEEVPKSKLNKVDGSPKINVNKKRSKFQKPTVAKKGDKLDKLIKYNKAIKKKEVQAQDTRSKNDNADVSEKPDWIEFKKQKKELREKRRAKRLTDAYEVTVKAKQLGEKLRRADCSKDAREKLASELYELLKGQFSKVVFMHDMARIVQWTLKYCTPDVRESIVNELKESIVLMLQSKYAKNCIRTILEYGTEKIRAIIISACNGNVVKLVSHSLSAPIIEYAYSSWATNVDKLNFKQEFYGDMYKQAKDSQVKTLADVYKSSEDLKLATLSAVKGNLIKILNKKLINMTLVHSVLLEFLKNCTKEDRSEIIVMCRSLIGELSQTKDGANSAMICLWHGTNKDRKLAMKALKDQVKNVAMCEHGYMILLATFDCIDDTVLVKKMILTELLDNLTEIAANEYGRYVILYLIARRDPHYFHPKLVAYLKQGDDNVISKKPSNIREKELLEAVIDKFLENIHMNAAMWLSNSSISMVTLAVLKAGDGAKLKNAYEAVANHITNPESIVTEEKITYKIVEHSGLHMMLKKLIQNDKTSFEKGKSTFGEVLIERLSLEVIKQWIEFNRGCFLLITLIECSVKHIADVLLIKLKQLTKCLQYKKTPGATILLNKLK